MKTIFQTLQDYLLDLVYEGFKDVKTAEVVNSADRFKPGVVLRVFGKEFYVEFLSWDTINRKFAIRVSTPDGKAERRVIGEDLEAKLIGAQIQEAVHELLA